MINNSVIDGKLSDFIGQNQGYHFHVSLLIITTLVALFNIEWCLRCTLIWETEEMKKKTQDCEQVEYYVQIYFRYK